MPLSENIERLLKAREKKPKKERKPIAKKSVKTLAKEKAEKDANGDTDLVRFYKSVMKRMTGHCLNCFARTETKVYSGAIFSICHILDKRDTMCPSVKDHVCNWVELCPDCHREFDTPPFEKDRTLWDKRMEFGFWNVVREKLVMIYPNIAEDEKRHIPESILKFMETEYPF